MRAVARSQGGGCTRGGEEGGGPGRGSWAALPAGARLMGLQSWGRNHLSDCSSRPL